MNRAVVFERIVRFIRLVHTPSCAWLVGTRHETFVKWPTLSARPTRTLWMCLPEQVGAIAPKTKVVVNAVIRKGDVRHYWLQRLKSIGGNPTDGALATALRQVNINQARKFRRLTQTYSQFDVQKPRAILTNWPLIVLALGAGYINGDRTLSSGQGTSVIIIGSAAIPLAA
jgi:hypothetical protein